MLPEISRAMKGNCKSFSINLKQKDTYDSTESVISYGTLKEMVEA